MVMSRLTFFFFLKFKPFHRHFSSFIITADRAKQIKTVAVVNEDRTEKLIRELTEENDRLRRQLSSKGGLDPSAQVGMSPEGPE